MIKVLNLDQLDLIRVKNTQTKEPKTRWIYGSWWKMSQNLQFFGKSNLMVSTNVIETLYSILNIVNINKSQVINVVFFKFIFKKLNSSKNVQ